MINAACSRRRSATAVRPVLPAVALSVFALGIGMPGIDTTRPAAAATVPLAAAVAADAACLGCVPGAAATLVRDLPTTVISADVALAATARGDDFRATLGRPSPGIPGDGPLAAVLYLTAALACIGLARLRVN
ncbi:MAG: hypothetical protein AAF899_10545 [Pseudomonadota bacterium]